ncbi:hypothetical protein ABID29_001496 [Streptococcus rupicaprae]|uniref:DUF6440 domain-containing protein n=1 Tax=Streptococcus rupicaprae TaxID=759619 RepID=A0ABV2FIN6_9STRE
MFFDEDKKEQKRVKQAAALEQQVYLQERFEVVYFVPEGMATAPYYIRDRETGVEYLHLNGAITPLLTPDGKPKVRQ